MTRSSSRQLDRRLAAAIALAIAAACSAPAGATASYKVHACDSATAGANRSWSVQRTSLETYLTAFTKCPTVAPDPSGDMQQGIGVFDATNSSGGAFAPSDGRYAEQRFTAPAETKITGAEIVRDIGNRSSFWRNYGAIDGVDQPSETCYRPQGEAFCRINGLKAFAGLNAHSLAYGARCDTADAHCSTGSTLHMVWALVRSATVTLDDTEAPTVSTPAATGLADGGWHRGAGSVTFTADDNTGIRVRRLVEGATTRATATAPNAGAGGCGSPNAGDAYTYLQPCAGTRGLNGTQAVPVADVCAWGDGEHAIRAAAEDTGGTTTTSSGSVTVRVDCTGPAVTTASPSGVDAGQTIEPDVTATDPRGVGSTEVQWQTGAMNYWKPYAGPITAEAGFSYRFRARATDALGNVSAWTSPSAWTQAIWTETPVERPTNSAQPAPRVEQQQTQQPGPEIAPAPPLLTPPLMTPKVPAARVTSSKFNRRTRTLRVRGTATDAASVVLKIRTQAKKPLTRKAKVRNGRFALTIRFSKRTRRARIVGIRVQALN